MSGSRPILVMSARPDGGSTVALGLAAVLAGVGRCALFDFDLERPEIAPQLDVRSAPNLYDLAYASRLAPVTRAQLEQHIHWRDGVGVLPGIEKGGDVSDLTPHFVESLITVAGTSFDHVVIDAGRLRPDLPMPTEGSTVLVVARPTPLGLHALERGLNILEEARSPWRAKVKVVLNQVSEGSIEGVPGYLEHSYGVEVVGRLPETSAYWRSVEMEHSARALTVPIPHRRRYLRAYGREALPARQALEDLARSLRAGQPREAGALPA